MKRQGSEPLVLVLNDYGTEVGGCDRIAIETAFGLADAGVNVLFVCGSGPIDERLLNRSNLQAIELGLKDFVSYPSKLKALRHGLWNRLATEALCRVLDDQAETPAIAHLHTYCKVLSAAVVAPLRRRRIPVVHTMHDYFAFSPNGIHFHFNRGEVLKGSALSLANLFSNPDKRHWSHHVFRTGRLLTQKMTSTFPAGIDRFLAVSNVSMRFAGQFLPIDKLKLLKYPNRPQHSTPMEPNAGASICYVGRLTREKGVLEIAEAAERTGVNLTFVGDGDLRESLETRYPGCHFTGWLEPEEVDVVLRRSRALVLGSLWYETFGLVVPDALRMGIPAIVSDRAGASELVRDGVNGRHWRAPDVEHLQELFAETKNDEIVRRWGQTAWQLYPELCHSMQDYTTGLMDQFDAIWTDQGKPSRNDPMIAN